MLDAQPTSVPAARPSRQTAAVVAVLTLAGAWARLVVARQDLFADELATYWIVATHGFGGVIRTVASTAEITPPLSFILSWLTTRTEVTPELIRLPALIAGIATVPLVYALGLRTAGRRAALVAAALTTVSPFMILYSAEARGYGVLMAVLVVSTLALVHAIDRPHLLWWSLYAVAITAAMYTHYTSVFVLGAQAVWAWWRVPACRRALITATVVAVLLYLPWLPSLKGDVESPTTEILSAFSPLSPDMVRVTLGHWSVGFPYAFSSTSLRALPGILPLLAMLGAVVAGLRGLIRGERPTDGPRAGLIALLALATPLGTFVQSVIGANVFSVRSLGASWPYLALAVAWVLVAAGPKVWVVASVAMVLALGVGGVTMLTSEFQRPSYGPVARFADDHDAAVVIDGVAFPPGPLTNLNVEETHPTAPILRLGVPTQLDRPFSIGDPTPVAADVFQEAAAMADGGPIVVASLQIYDEVMDDLIATLPEGYEVTDEMRASALYLYDLRVVVVEQP